MNWRFPCRTLGFRMTTLLCGPLSISFFVAVTPAAQAQLVAPVGAASAPAEDPMERAKRQANNVMRWIKVHSDKPRANAAKPNEPAAAPAPAPVARPAPKTAAPPANSSAYAPAAVAEKPGVAAPAAPDPVVLAPPPVAAPVAPPPVAAAAPAIAKAAPPAPPPEEEEDTPLKALAQPQPVLPRNVLSTINVAKVMVRFNVEVDGSVSNVEIVRSSNRLLNKPTITAVSSWRFEPIKVARPAQVEIDFSL